MWVFRAKHREAVRQLCADIYGPDQTAGDGDDILEYARPIYDIDLDRIAHKNKIERKGWTPGPKVKRGYLIVLVPFFIL